MKTFDIPRNFITVLAAMILALVMTFMPNGSAFADGIDTIEITYGAPSAQDAQLLRHLLSNPELNVEQQHLLDRTLDGVYEELADASPAPSQDKGFIQSVNDLLGVKSGDIPTQAKG